MPETMGWAHGRARTRIACSSESNGASGRAPQTTRGRLPLRLCWFPGARGGGHTRLQRQPACSMARAARLFLLTVQRGDSPNPYSAIKLAEEVPIQLAQAAWLIGHGVAGTAPPTAFAGRQVASFIFSTTPGIRLSLICRSRAEGGGSGAQLLGGRGAGRERQRRRGQLLGVYPVLQSPRYDRPREQTLGRGHT